MEHCKNEAEAKKRGPWVYRSKNDQLILSDADTCLEAPTWEEAEISLYACHGQKGNQEWILTEAGMITHGGGGCLVASDGMAKVKKCKDGDATQQWEFRSTAN
jgi:hypothetical protein